MGAIRSAKVLLAQKLDDNEITNAEYARQTGALDSRLDEIRIGVVRGMMDTGRQQMATELTEREANTQFDRLAREFPATQLLSPSAFREFTGEAARKLAEDGITLTPDAQGNPGPGAWGAYWRDLTDEEIELSGFDPDTTNQRMELMGPIAALEAIKEPGPLLVLSDSQYVVKGITRWIDGWKHNGWRTTAKKPVKNRDLWERLDAARSKRVGFQWVRGHAGDPGNERADFIARRCLLTALQGNIASFRAAVKGFSRHDDFDPRPYLEGGP